MMFFFPFICRPAPTTCSELSRWLIQSELQVAFLIMSRFLSPVLLLSPKLTGLSFLSTCSIYPWPFESPLTQFFPNFLNLFFFPIPIYQSIVSELELKNPKMKIPIYSPRISKLLFCFFIKHRIFWVEYQSFCFSFKESEWFMYRPTSIPKKHHKSTLNAMTLNLEWCM